MTCAILENGERELYSWERGDGISKCRVSPYGEDMLKMVGVHGRFLDAFTAGT